MKVTSQQKIKLGIFTIVALLVLFVGIFVIGSRKNMFKSTFTVYGTFKNVGGLQVGNNVRFVGINVGTVDAIEIISDSLARVDMLLQSKVKKFLKKNAVASIGSDGLMGDKLIVISSINDSTMTASATALKDGDQIKTINPIDYDKVLGKATRIIDNAEALTNNLSDIVAKVNSGHGSIGRLLNSDSLARNLEGTANSAKSALNSVKKGSEGFSENMQALHGNFLFRKYYRKKEKEQEKEQKKKERDAKKKHEGNDADSTKAAKN
ncbi:MlaD family protein [Pinibacter soli]|uniref:MlaD family protein n=1 Tax=Pinibacter soli TaxID=3044211 RepID=A0ABT6RHK7_9BACT|nr:MlaD family protein [Pinibacter soli]MDI3321329.1 MlaD family protein [Pinibacter soli]